MIRTENLSFRYRRNQPLVIDQLNLEIGSGRIYGLLGPNGNGKSTLLFLLSGLLTPTSGVALFRGVDVRKRKPEVMSDIFIVPEEFSLPSVTLKEYVKINSRFYPRFSQEDLQRNLEIFDMDAGKKLTQMSMGQRKKSFLSFALACNTSLLLMDEPTNGLDIPGKSQFRRFVVSSMTDERSIVISTHQVRDIDKILYHLIMLSNSGVMLDCSTSEVVERLKFITTSSSEDYDDVLYSRSTIGGSEIIVKNDDEETTELNLETLFELVYSQPELIKSIFGKL